MPYADAVVADKSALSPGARAEIAALSQRRPGPALLQAASAWLVIVAAVSLALWADHFLVSLLAIVVVATRQNVLGLLVHEQTHCLAFKARPGDLIINLVAAWPLLVLTVENYARVHLAHHKSYFSENDPDHLRKSGPDWHFPKRRGALFRLFVSDLIGLNVLRMVRGKKEIVDPGAFPRPRTGPAWLRPAYYATVAAILTATGSWHVFLLYWLLPLVTVFQVIVRWGAICEHHYNALGEPMNATTPLILPSRLDRLLLPNLNFTYHAYHHYFPGIPFYNLPAVHRVFQREGLVDESQVHRGNLAFFRAHVLDTALPPAPQPSASGS